ncbi:MAG: hypothetical protein A6D91_08050 [Bacillaceae bacterium G1]|nr:spore gernimation protein GerD [Bacillota bacterium]OJF17587.1 MAG: hypothetical protein A6D91_08050 [Bacillaceae bacterium G1]
MNHLTGRTILIISCLAVFLSGCSPAQRPQQETALPYESTKEMVVDILKTDDGKKAIQEMFQDREFQKQVVLSGEDFKTMIQETITAEENREKLNEIIREPKFAAELAKALQEQTKQLLKDLMKDPEYRSMLHEVFQDPEFQQEQLELLKSNAFRQQIITVMKESLDSPMFQEELVQLMMKAQEEATKPKEKSGEKGQGSDGGQGESQKGS